MRSLVFDIESWSADLRYAMPPEEFVRLTGFRWAGESEVTLTTDLEQVREVIRSADMVIGHNVNAYDLPAVFGSDSDEPVIMADQGRVYDTFTHAGLVNPAPTIYIDRNGRERLGGKPSQAMAWFSLDEQAYQLGVARKTDDLRGLAREYGTGATPTQRARDGFGKIPTDDPRYRAYLVGDVMASDALARALLELGPLNPYAMREQRIAARAARISSNGFRVDQVVAEKRTRDREERKAELLEQLAAYGLPVGGRKPWASKAGRAAILAFLEEHGVTPELSAGWKRTKAGQLSLGAEVLQEITSGTEASEIGDALAELQGQRSLSQLASDSMHADGFVHPQITMLQRSGRWSTTMPGLTIWSQRDKDKRQEKSVFIPDRDTDVLIELDYQAADARIVAALSGDQEYAKLFKDDIALAMIVEITGDPGYVERVFRANHVGVGLHAVNAVRAFGAEVVETDPGHYREAAKRLSHAWNYGAGTITLSRTTGLDQDVADNFCRMMASTYVRIGRWQAQVRREGERGAVTNLWGRRIPIERGRAYTQAPALHGQSGTREIVCDSILKMPLDLLRCVKAQIHDAIVVSVPKEEWEAYGKQFRELMETELNPEDGLRMSFPVESGPPAHDWASAAH
jgi:DNA polymerase-1